MGDSNEAWFERACRVTPGGVNSPVRAFRAVGGTPYFVARGEGAYVWDVEGRRYLDYVQSYGASILGHADPGVVAAVTAAAARGSTYGAPTTGEVRLAEAICERVEGCDMVRLVSSGTEAAMSAVRVARGATGRDRIVVFEGCYHGHSDGLLAGGGSGVATLGLPASAGVPRAAVAETLVVPYNALPEIGSDVAAVIVEPIAANMGLVPPVPGFLEGLRSACDRAGAVLIFDEVITGFRVGAGGASGLLGVQPDLWCFGKVIGGGLPLAAFGGRRDLMSELAPVGPVYQAGTLSGNPVATAAGLEVLARLDAGAYEDLASRAGRLARGLAQGLSSAGLPAQVPRVGPLVGLFLGPLSAPPASPPSAASASAASARPVSAASARPVSAHPVRDFAGAKESVDRGLYPGLMHGLLDRGVALAPGAYEILFPSLSHTDADIDRTIEAATEAASLLPTH